MADPLDDLPAAHGDLAGSRVFQRWWAETFAEIAAQLTGGVDPRMEYKVREQLCSLVTGGVIHRKSDVPAIMAALSTAGIFRGPTPGFIKALIRTGWWAAWYLARHTELTELTTDTLAKAWREPAPSLRGPDSA